MAEGREFDVIVLGSGISGLTAAWRLARNGRKVLLAEKKDRVAGVIASVRKDDFLLEKGPNSFTSFPPVVMEVIREIGLIDRAYQEPLKENDRFVFYNGKLRKVPMGMKEFLQTDILSTGEKLRLIRGLFKRGKTLSGDVTLGEYFRPRIGDAPVERMLKPFMAGVYAADADRVSFESVLNKLYKPATKRGSIFGAMKELKKGRDPNPPRPQKALVSFPKGLREFAEKLAESFREAGGVLKLDVAPQVSRNEGMWRAQLNGETFEAQELIVASSAPDASKLLGEIVPEPARILGEIEYAPLVVAHAGIKEEQIAENRPGFGFLSVDGQGVRVLGMIWNDRIFENRAPSEHRLLTCFFGGEKDPEITTWSDERIREQLEADLKTSMGYTGGGFRLLEFTRWEKALPIFRVGHMRKVENILADLPDGLHLMGNYLGGVSIPDRVDKAITLADYILNSPIREKITV